MHASTLQQKEKRQANTFRVLTDHTSLTSRFLSPRAKYGREDRKASSETLRIRVQRAIFDLVRRGTPNACASHRERARRGREAEENQRQ